MNTAIDKSLSARIDRLEESATIAMAQKSRELKAQGIDIISLSLGEPDFNTPDFVKEAAKKAIDDNFSFYMPVPGYASLREAITLKFKRDNGLDYNAKQIVVSTGAKQAIANVMMSLLDHGDEALLPVPFWVTYKEIVKMANATPVEVTTSLDADFKLSAAQLEEAITPKTRLLIFSSPCNPTGSAYTHEEFQALAEVIARHPRLVVVADEIYEHILFEGKHASLASIPEVYDQVVTVNGVSKGFAMTGWRIGYIGAPEWIAAACTKMQGQFTSGTCGIAQKAAEAALRADPSVVNEMVEEFGRRRNLVLAALKAMPGVKCNDPEGAFYVFPDVSAFFGKSHGAHTIGTANDLTMYLLEEARVALVTGEAFGDPNCLRVAYATSTDLLTEAMSRIAEALSKLN